MSSFVHNPIFLMWRLVCTHRAFSISIVLGLLLLPLPLVGSPGIESSLLLSLIFASWVAARSAGIVHSHTGSRLSAVHHAIRDTAMLVGGAAAVLVLGSSLLHPCSRLQGLDLLALGLGGSWLVSCATGIAVGSLVANARWAKILAIFIPWIDVAAGLHRLWATPQVYVYGHFYGYFPGPLYDELITVQPAYLWLRTQTLCIVISLFSIALASHAPKRILPWLVAILSAFACAAFQLKTEPHGIQSSAPWIRAQLGQTLRSKRCLLVVPSEMPHHVARLHAQDCDAHITRIEQSLQVTLKGILTAYMFRTADEKKTLMGAAHTNIAKPWLREVYLQAEAWPHPILAHEIAHVVAGVAAQGPMHVSGKLSGWIPDPAMIEGMAVALAWPSDSDLSQEPNPHQWAAALVHIGKARPLTELLGPNFLTQSAGRGYTQLGSVFKWMLETRGPAVLRQIYASGDVTRATGLSLPVLDQAWRESLKQQTLSPELIAEAIKRFDAPSIFYRACPRQVAELRRGISEAMSKDLTARAQNLCSQLRAISPNDVTLELLQMHLDIRKGNPTPTKPSDDSPGWARVKFIELQGDDAWLRGDTQTAARMYDQALVFPVFFPEKRMLQVKKQALKTQNKRTDVFRELLLGSRQGPASETEAMYLASRLAQEHQTDGLGLYLLGRQLFNLARFEEAHSAMTDALQQSLPTEALLLEAQRLLHLSAQAIHSH